MVSQHPAKKLGSYLTVLRRMLQAKVVLPASLDLSSLGLTFKPQWLAEGGKALAQDILEYIIIHPSEAYISTLQLLWGSFKTCCKKEAHKYGCTIPGSVQGQLGEDKNCTSEHYDTVSAHADATHKLYHEEVS